MPRVHGEWGQQRKDIGNEVVSQGLLFVFLQFGIIE